MEIAEYKKMDSIEARHFWFKAKRDFLKIVIDRFLSQKKAKILDVGCGTGAVLQDLKKNGYDVFGIDSSDQAIFYCIQKGLNVKKGDATNLGYEKDTFDAVMLLDVIEHLEDDKSAVAEAYKVLKPGGIAIITVPAHKFLWSYHDVSLHHKRRYNKKQLMSLFGTEWKIEVFSWLHALTFLPAFIIRSAKSFFGFEAKESDVKMPNSVINMLMNWFYVIELFIFRIFLRLPFGVSLMIVARKK